MKNFYFYLKLFKYRIFHIFHISYTYWIAWWNSVDYSSFKSKGVPIINRFPNSRIVWGHNLSINNGNSGNRIGFNTPCIFRAEGGNIIIGDNVGISQSALVAKSGGDIKIGNNVLLGGGVKIYASDFHSVNYIHRRNPLIDSQKRNSSSINIEDDCFIGAGTIILKGVSIGARTIIGAGSVVTNNIPSDCIAAGNPCKVIKYLANQ